MKILRIILIFLFISSFSFAQVRVQSLAKEGMEQAYNFQLVNAEKIFERIIDEYPNSPEGYYRTALLHFWIYLGSRDPGVYQVFLKFANIANEKIEKQLQKNPKDYYTKYIAGNLLLFRSMAQATNGQSIDAFWSSKNAIDYFEEVIKIKPNFYDVYLGLGLLDYAMSFVPDFLKWAVNLTGLTSDKNRGLRYIKLAFQKGNYSKTEAAFHLSKIYTDYLSEYDSAYSILQNLIASYPQSGLFKYQYAVSLIKGKKLDQANFILNELLKIKNKKIPQINALAYFRKGEIYFKKNNFSEAIKNYEKFLDLSRELDFNGIAALNIAISYKMLNNDEEFRKNLLLAKNGNQDIFEDTYAFKKANYYLEDGISEDELYLIKIKNQLDSGNYRNVYNSLKKNERNFSNDLKALQLIYFAEATLYLGKYKESIELCNEIFDLEINKEKWIVPMANFITASANYSLKNKQIASEFLKKAEDYNEYDFKDLIQSKIEFLKRRLNK